jgi:hypothetical protein
MQQNSIVGRRIVKSNIQLTISRQYSVTSFIHLNRLSSTLNIPFQLKQNTNLIKPQIRERIETLQQAVYRTRSFFER